ncbi:MAG: GGDEF domain-containing protein [Gammaproteobacteria bacterium]|nr:GGDEF domain-containing protein [Gammaproteobacteria bacterium]
MRWEPLNRLFIPLVLLVSVLVLRERLLNLKSFYLQLLFLLPYITLVAAMVISCFFNRARSFTTAFALMVAYWIFATQLQKPLSDPNTFITFSVLSLGLPLTFIVLLLTGERSLRTLAGLWIVAIVPVQLGIVIWLRGEPTVLVAISRYMPILSYGHYNLSLIAGVLYTSCILLATFILFKQNNEHAASVLTSAVFSFCVFAFYGLPKISIVVFGAAGLALISSLIRSSHEMAYRDELTGLRSRRALNERMKSLSRQFVIAMIDVDHFKKFNDSYGHAVGDDVLKMVAKKLASVKSGVAYRYGGEEFCFVFSGKALEQCKPNLETTRLAIANYRLYVRDIQDRPSSRKAGKLLRGSGGKGQITSVTVSIGAAESNKRRKQPQNVLKLADEALYRAKKNGRNRLVCQSSD